MTADDTPEKAAFDAACARIAELVGMIADLRSQGPAGLAVKSYLRYHNVNPGPYGSRPATLGDLGMDAGSTYGDLEVSIIADAVRFVPELGPLAAAVIGSAEKAAA